MPPSPSSPFAALLRRSKFASYDPSIAQVYATYGGEATRGNWGLKRPLPLRRRKAFITVKAIDSREEQTEWKSAEEQNRFIRMWDETAVPPTVVQDGSWFQTLGPDGEVRWDLDSEFSPKPSAVLPKPQVQKVEVVEETQTEVEVPAEDPVITEAKQLGVGAPRIATPNVHAMSDKEFERYLRKLRELRPTFQKYLRAQSLVQNRKAPELSTWQYSQRTSSAVKEFISSQEYLNYKSATSQTIEQQPHRSGGLSYNLGPLLQTFLYTKPQPGRILGNAVTTRGSDNLATFAGNTSVVDKSYKPGNGIDWQKLTTEGIWEPRTGAEDLRFTETKLVDPPETVGRSPKSVAGGMLYTQAMSVGEMDKKRLDLHWIGSKECVGVEPIRSRPPSILKHIRKKTQKLQTDLVEPTQVLNTLQGIIHKGTQ